MTASEGFLLVLKAPEDIMPTNPRYRGLDRTPPYREDKVGEGFVDPLIFLDYMSEEGLIRSLPLAQDVLDRFAEMESRDRFEIIYAQTCGSTPAPRVPPAPGLRFLGFDVACYAPFYSVVDDVPSDYQSHPETKVLVDRLNEHGLFDSIDDALAYLEAYRTNWLSDEEQDLVFHFWEVYLVE